MLLDAIGSLLPVAAATGLSPFPIAAVSLILAGPRSTTAGPAFAAGWTVGLIVLTGVLTVVATGVEDSEPQTWVSVLRVLGGLALLVLAAQKWRKRPRGEEQPPTPGWMASLDEAGAGRAGGIGLLLSAANPKIIAFTAAACSIIGESDVDGAEAFVASAVYVLVSSAAVIAAVLVRLILGERARGPLQSVKDFMVRNNNVIMMVVFGLLGAKILGDGLAGL